MTSTLEKSKNFRIDALLALDVEQRTVVDGSSPRLYYNLSPGESPGSTCGSKTPSPPHPNTSPSRAGVLTKSQLLNLSGFGAAHQERIIGMHPGSMYPLAALGGQHPAFIYPGFAQLVQPFPQQLKGATMAGTLPLEPWVRAGMMIPRVGEYGGDFLSLNKNNSYIFYMFVFVVAKISVSSIYYKLKNINSLKYVVFIKYLGSCIIKIFFLGG